MTPSPSTLSAQQRRVLDALGVDVWVRRTAVERPAPRVSATPMVQVSQVARAAAFVPPVAPAAQADVELRIQFDCVAAPGVVAVGGFANPLDRRIALDIVHAIAGVSAQLQLTQFRWPQTQTRDAGVAAAANAYREFLRGQVERAGARWLLLFGVTAPVLVDTLEGVGDVTILRLPAAAALRADPQAKKQLWLSVSQPVQA